MKNCAMLSILSSEKKNVFVFNFAHGKLTPVPRTHHVLVNTINDYFRVNQFQRHHLQENSQRRQTKDPVITLFILVWTDLFTKNILKLLPFISYTEQRFSSQNGFICKLHICCFLILHKDSSLLFLKWGGFSKVRESSFFLNRTSLTPLRFLMRIFGKIPK